MKWMPVLLLIGSTACAGADAPAEDPLAERLAGIEAPNFVIIFCDDLGYGDLGRFGHPTIRTPELDRMSDEGLRFTQFYSASSVCTPSRAALLTGRLPIRSGMCGHKRRMVQRQNGSSGLLPEEITLAEVLSERGYATAAVGKWHLGHLPPHLPTNQGFDRFFGMPWSNDMKPYYYIRNEEPLEGDVDQTGLTRRLTEESIDFIRANRDRPFFLYLAHAFPHTPLFASENIRGQSLRGLYGDVVEELDWSTGQILATLRELGLENTLVIFTSDNGPWLIRKQNGGSAGMLRDGKGSTFEGGMRVPTIAWWPEQVRAGRTSMQIASTMDLFRTFSRLAGAQVPEDRTLDSHDLAPVLLETGDGERERLFYYRGKEIYAARLGAWKAHFHTKKAYGGGERETHDPPLLYNLHLDPGEHQDRAAEHPEIVAEITAMVEAHRASFVPPPSQLELLAKS